MPQHFAVKQLMTDRQRQRQTEAPAVSIGVLARKVGLSPSAIRKYGKEGLLIAHQAVSGHHFSSHEDTDRIVDFRPHDPGPWSEFPGASAKREHFFGAGVSSRWPQQPNAEKCFAHRFRSRCTQIFERFRHDQYNVPNAGAAILRPARRRGYPVNKEC
ncbi:MAG: MerR family DNA-binding transcriptional regulator [Pirellulales bacterium]|nr:MerR family DNA-binding transcriptional regulator [Pirellulales bacterium]